MTIQKIKQEYSSEINLFDLDLLLESILHKSKEFLALNPKYSLSVLEYWRLRYFLRQLKKGKPINYIIGQKEFYGFNFMVNRHTLIPRPETEQIIDLVKEIISKNLKKNIKSNFTVIDLGTGSGNIIITLAKYIQGVHFYASDISKRALAVAKTNAQYHQVGIRFIEGNLLEPFQKLLTTKLTAPVISGCCSNISASCDKLSPNDIKKKILIITANLPYLSTKIYKTTAKNVQNYEPINALISGEKGLDHYRKMLKQLKIIHRNKTFSFQKIYLFFEISPEQKNIFKKEILKLFPSAKINFHKDLAQKWRVVTVKIAR